MSTPLPRPNPFDSTYLPDSHSGYLKCLELEDHHAVVKKTTKLTVLVCARLLGYMLVEALEDATREEFASEIVRCTDDEALQALAGLYKDHLIHCFLLTKGRTPISTPSSFDATEEEYTPPLQVTLMNYTEAKQKVLIRDNHRCLLTGRLDGISLEAGSVADNGFITASTRAAHIFDWSINDDLDTNDKLRHAESIRVMLGRFGNINTDELKGANAHRLQNILTLDSSVHEWFGQLKVWLERRPEDPDNYYRPAATKPFLLRGIPAGIQLATPDPASYPLPDPRYIAVHAACARVAHLSGAGEYLDIVSREVEGITVDDGSGDVLYHALMRHLEVEVQ
ncbi:hypothetical protein BD779DRAFT_1146539 [Infundibulicybe gibba]|nr:hypothetical protein BD779DRAFT_1146539 [Infundibulicybe gibba]